jgi:hypothetical protein
MKFVTVILTQSLEKPIQNAVAGRKTVDLSVPDRQNLEPSPVDPVQEYDSAKEIPCVTRRKEIRIDLNTISSQEL